MAKISLFACFQKWLVVLVAAIFHEFGKDCYLPDETKCSTKPSQGDGKPGHNTYLQALAFKLAATGILDGILVIDLVDQSIFWLVENHGDIDQIFDDPRCVRAVVDE